MSIRRALSGRANENGNALFLILIAVALFAALSYAITQSGRGSGTVNKEGSMITAGQVVQYAAGLRTAATRMVITGTPTSGATGISLCCVTGLSNELFDQAGGGASILPPPPEAIVTPGTLWGNMDARNATLGFYIKDVGTNVNVAGREVYAFLVGVTLPVCQQILKGLGVANFMTPSPSAVAMDWFGPPLATFNVAQGNTLSGAGIDGQPFLCYQRAAGVYDYYHVLIEQ